MIDLSAAVDSQKTGDYVVRRTRRGTTTKGRYTPGPQSTVTIPAQVTPVEGEELQRLPELSRVDEVRRVITSARLYAQTSAFDPDVMEIDGFDWEVSIVKDWSKSGSFWEAFVTRKREA